MGLVSKRACPQTQAQRTPSLKLLVSLTSTHTHLVSRECLIRLPTETSLTNTDAATGSMLDQCYDTFTAFSNKGSSAWSVRNQPAAAVALQDDLTVVSFVSPVAAVVLYGDFASNRL